MLNSSDIYQSKILIIDDQQANISLLSRMLHGAGYTAISSTMKPGEARELHRNNHYDLILLDLKMPNMDGFKVMEELKEIEPGGYLPVVVITAQPEHKLRALKAGAKDFISIPFDLAEVLARVHNMLEVRLLHETLRNHSEMMESQALHDPLTGLANRRLLADRMSMSLIYAQRNKSAMAVLFLDLDGFKQVNDTLGHSVGDALLKMVADRLLATVRKVDTVARLGGDEFIISLWHISGISHAANVALKVIEAVSQPYYIENHTVSVTTSAGIAIYPIHGESAEILMKNADLALYEAKCAGKNAYRIAAVLAAETGSQDSSTPSHMIFPEHHQNIK